MPDSKIIIQVKHMCKIYGGKKVLDDVSFDVKEGEFVTLLGPSGCGKTTILRNIAGFISPDSGEVILDGKNIDEIPPYMRPLNTVFQRYALFPHLDVYDNIAFGLKLQKVPEDEIEKRVRKVLKLVSMSDYEDRDVDSLSGGQQQRVAIARAIVNQPKVLLLDEPLSALDLKMRKDMQIELKEMHKKLGITFIYVTHDQEEALTLSDTIIVLNEGRILQIGSPADIYNEPQTPFVADFIGESNILDGIMLEDRKVRFLDHDFDCVDEGFGCNTPVDVVIRPEDIYIMNQTSGAQFTAKVESCTFKGVHYEMFVETANGYELQIQDYNAFEPGTTVGLIIKPEDIQVMHKERLCNSFEGEMADETHVVFAGAEFECLRHEGIGAGDKVTVKFDFGRVDLMDHEEEGVLEGDVHFLIYKGNRYHLEVVTPDHEKIYAETNDIWDRGDHVGINIAAADIHLEKRDEI